MARKPQEEERNDGWKDTYGDMVTLLLCFFVLLYSMSSVNSEKWEQFIKAFQNPGEDTAQIVITTDPVQKGDHMVPGNEMQDGAGTEPTEEPPLEFDQLFEHLQEYVEEHNMQNTIELNQGEGVVYVRYQNSLFFRPDSSELTAEAKPNLDFLGNALKEMEDELWLISISGHTASVQSDGYSVSDWRLSGARASEVAVHFEEVNGLDPKLLRPIGFGKNYPIADNSTSEGRERNRRVELVIISKDSPFATSDSLASAVSGLFNADVYEEKGDMSNIEQLLDPDLLDELTDASSGASSSESQPDAGEADSSAGSEDAGEADTSAGSQDAGSASSSEITGQPADSDSAATSEPPGEANSGQNAPQE